MPCGYDSVWAVTASVKVDFAKSKTAANDSQGIKT